MHKLKRQLKNQNRTLKEFIENYDAVTLHSALSAFEGSAGWGLLQAYAQYVQRSYEVQAMDLLGTGESNQKAAYASGYAKACEDLASFAEGARKTILGTSDVVEVPRPEE